jgi:hypothetical protein
MQHASRRVRHFIELVDTADTTVTEDEGTTDKSSSAKLVYAQ